MTASRFPFARAFAFGVAMGFTFVSPALGQARYDHTPAIDAALRSVGGVSGLASARPGDLSALFGHLQARGGYLLGLYEFQRSLGADYSAFRDTVPATIGLKVVWAPYYLGRHLQETGDVDGARAAYRRVQGDTEVGADARAWLAALDGTGNGWQAAYWKWRQGEATATPDCPAAGADACPLLSALIDDDLVAIARAQAALMSEKAPVDRMMRLSAAPGDVGVEFFDPALPLLMASADYRLAAAALEPISDPRATVLRGMNLVMARRFSDAAEVLQGAGGGGAQAGLAKAYLGAALYGTGERRAAERVWTEAAQGASEETAAHLLSLWADIDHPRTRSLVKDRASTREIATILARGLIRAGEFGKAVDTMSRQYDPLWGTDPAQVRPDFLVVMAHARYEVGRDLWGLARELWVPLQPQFPPQSGAVAMLQELSIPTGKNRTIREE